MNLNVKVLNMKKFLIYILFTTSLFAQIGELIWEENFNDLDDWLKITGNGSWGWGNGELEFYKEENVSISQSPNDPNNNALHIIARNESGPEITDQWGNPIELYFWKSYFKIKYFY